MSEHNLYDIEGYFYHSSNSSINQYDNENGQCKNEDVSTRTSQKDKKLQRNRMSAQNSRQKKKMYIEELEDNEKELIKQIELT